MYEKEENAVCRLHTVTGAFDEIETTMSSSQSCGTLNTSFVQQFSIEQIKAYSDDMKTHICDKSCRKPCYLQQ